MVPTTGDDGWEEGDDDDVEVGDEQIENGNGERADIAIAFPNPFTIFESVPIRTSFLRVYVNEYNDAGGMNWQMWEIWEIWEIWTEIPLQR